MRRRRRLGALAVGLCALGLLGGAALAGADATEPMPGGWKGKTKQGFPIYFGVREGPTVANVRLTYKDVICGKLSPRNPTLTMTVDESGHFSGVVYPANGGVRIEGTFTGPSSMKGVIAVGEDSGIPGCLGGKFKFTAYPKS
jgi:hypothetical protein